MRRCSLSAPKTFAPGPMKSSAPPTCPKSALSPLPLIRQLPPRRTTRIRDEKCYASGASRHQPSLVPSDVLLDGILGELDRVVVHEFGSDQGDRHVTRTASMPDPAEDVPTD